MIVTATFEAVIQINLVISEAIFCVASAKDGHLPHCLKSRYQKCVRGGSHISILKLSYAGQAPIGKTITESGSMLHLCR